MKHSSKYLFISASVFVPIALTMIGDALISPRIALAQAQPQRENASKKQQPTTEKNHSWGWMGRWMEKWMGKDHRRGMGGRMGPGMDRGSGMGQGRPSMLRHQYFMRNGIPEAYRGKISSIELSPKIIAEGAVLYSDNCASCHGPKGFGDGEAGRNLNPPPANIARMMGMPIFSDEYLFWTISEGGTPVGSAMPVFKNTLNEEEIWKIIAAARAGFPAPKDKQ